MATMFVGSVLLGTLVFAAVGVAVTIWFILIGSLNNEGTYNDCNYH